MVFTTHFGLHSQTNRLLENVSYRTEQLVKDGIFTLYDALFQRTCTSRQPRKRFSKLQFALEASEISNLSCSRFTRRY